ncbi:flagellar basal body rod protein FlgC [Calorimonas adulescens]|jgi:flagellar basal-body rod protein FlgC|uniref:Flagellar basal-body rod protein FlgC n=1 Tax=Calorimonas adulescens TaxID=2606906 RepID=A0A5D8QGK8_9THEO|nr:flagellar basal body rod protein FlgC [Calorimonas adulescens]TZE83359.1 flagellar basal body rod protein FlgC [Calorimonas adulescens]
MGMFDTINISASGLTAERLRMDIIADNIANANVTRTQDGGPYRRKIAIFSEKDNFSGILNEEMNGFSKGGVEVKEIAEDQSPFKLVYQPGHPDARADGYVEYPNVDVVLEMVDLISASRAYEANMTVINDTKNMLVKTLDLAK